jgi:hypothetical protein
VSDIAAELRRQCERLRTKPIPLAEMIPLMQRAADALEAAAGWKLLAESLRDLGEADKRIQGISERYGLADGGVEVDRDTDGELLIDWSPGKGRMLSVTLRADGRLSYAFTWDGEQAHGTAQMPSDKGVA